MHILLSDKDKELLRKVDTSKMGWMNDPILKQSKAFQTLKQFEKSMEVQNARLDIHRQFG